MPDDDAVRKPTRFELALDFLKARLLTIVGIAAVGAGIAMIVGFDIQLTRWQKIIGYTTLAFAPVGLLVGKYLASMLYDPRRVYVIDLDARHIKGALFVFPYEDFRELEVCDEDRNPHPAYEMTRLTPNLYCAKAVDLESQTVVGTWRGTLDDRELVRALGKIKECRGMLQDDAQRGWAIENSSFSIVRRAAQDEVRSISDTFAEGTLATDGASISNAVDAALEDHGFEDDLDDLDDLVPTPEEASANRNGSEQIEGRSTPSEATTNGAERTDTPTPNND